MQKPSTNSQDLVFKMAGISSQNACTQFIKWLDLVIKMSGLSSQIVCTQLSKCLNLVPKIIRTYSDLILKNSLNLVLTFSFIQIPKFICILIHSDLVLAISPGLSSMTTDLMLALSSQAPGTFSTQQSITLSVHNSPEMIYFFIPRCCW